MTDQEKRKEVLKLYHNLIELPQGKSPSDLVAERHEMVLLIEAAKSNPNGDPDTGNMPRMQPDTMKGLMTDVCLKRKIRNFFSLYGPNGQPLSSSRPEGHRIFIREGAVLQEQIEDDAVKNEAEILFKNWFLSEVDKSGDEDRKETLKAAISGTPNNDTAQEKLCKEIRKRYEAAWEGKKQKKKAKADSDDGGKAEGQPPEADTAKKRKQDAALDALDKILRHSKENRDCAWRDALCKTYSDVRYFGGVVSTEGPLKGSFYGQIRGPIQIGFAESLDRVLPLDFSITRCASASEDEDATSESEEGGNRTMGRKHIVDYAIYRCHAYFSPAFAARTGFSYYDLDNFLFALTHMFTDDKAAARTGMRVVGLIDFQHSTALGNEHAHKLFEMVKVARADAVDPKTGRRKDFPQSIEDYSGTLAGMTFRDGGNGSKVPVATVREKDEGGDDKALVIGRKVVWDIPEKVLT
jgi:CRISPR-associated protein Csd2